MIYAVCSHVCIVLCCCDRTCPDVNVRAEYRGAPLPGGCQPHAASAGVTAGQRGLARPGDGAVSCEAAVKLYVLLDTLCNTHTLSVVLISERNEM